MKRLLWVTVQFFFPFGRRRLDIVGYLIVFLLLFFPLGGWKLIADEIDTSDEEWVYGAVYDLPGFRWVQVANRYGVETLDTKIRRFDNCILRYRGRVQEIINHSTWWSSMNDEVLVEYSAPGDSDATGVLCPSGTVFYISREELALFQEKYEQRQSMETEIRDEVADALDQKLDGATYEVEEFFTWVEIMNPAGVVNFGFSLGFLESCGIEVLGEIQEIGQTQWGALYEYLPDPERGLVGVGIPCPASTLFLLDGSQPISRAAVSLPSA